LQWPSAGKFLPPKISKFVFHLQNGCNIKYKEIILMREEEGFDYYNTQISKNNNNCALQHAYNWM